MNVSIYYLREYILIGIQADKRGTGAFKRVKLLPPTVNRDERTRNVLLPMERIHGGKWNAGLKIEVDLYLNLL